MAKFVMSKERPKDLQEDCIVIDAPSFMDEVIKSAKKKPQSKTMTPNYMREIIAAIADKYADDNFSALTSVNVSPFRGVPCEKDEKTHEAICKILRTSYPAMFDLYIEYYIKSRPHGTKLIYFLGDFTQTSKFFEHGIDQIKEKDIPSYLGKAPKKVIGKPAVKDSEVKDLKVKNNTKSGYNNTDGMV